MKLSKVLLVFSFIMLVVACKTNPFTGEKNLNFVSNSQIFPTSFQQYDQVLAQSQVIRNTTEARTIENVGQRIATAAKRFLDANGYQGYLDEYQWEFTLLADETINAWAMPGGKIAFYSGILPIAQDETGIATIMAHEVAHALADHGAQRMSAQQLQQLGAVVGTVALSGKDEQTQQIFAQAYGMGSELGVMLPFSRSHETEADRIGLTLMALAGYDPAQAPNLWRRMKEAGGAGPPEFLSTHPSPDTRIRNLEQWAPQAKEEAAKYGVTSFR